MLGSVTPVCQSACTRDFGLVNASWLEFHRAVEISVVGLGISNLGSLIEAFRRIGASCNVVTSPEEILASRSLVLPGVGAFGEGIAAIDRLGLRSALVEYATSRRPLLGICLGMQLLLDLGHESGLTPGLGLVPGEVRRLEKKTPDQRIPNMGWCEVTWAAGKSGIGLMHPEAFYFLHSYECRCWDEADVMGTIDLGYPVAAALRRENVYGVQFHPEKSQDPGLDFLEKFSLLR